MSDPDAQTHGAGQHHASRQQDVEFVVGNVAVNSSLATTDRRELLSRQDEEVSFKIEKASTYMKIIILPDIPENSVKSENDFKNDIKKTSTTLQSIMNDKLSPHRFWPCYANGLIKTIQKIPHNLYVSFKLTYLYCGLRIILVYPNP